MLKARLMLHSLPSYPSMLLRRFVYEVRFLDSMTPILSLLLPIDLVFVPSVPEDLSFEIFWNLLSRLFVHDSNLIKPIYVSRLVKSFNDIWESKTRFMSSQDEKARPIITSSPTLVWFPIK